MPLIIAGTNEMGHSRSRRSTTVRFGLPEEGLSVGSWASSWTLFFGQVVFNTLCIRLQTLMAPAGIRVIESEPLGWIAAGDNVVSDNDWSRSESSSEWMVVWERSVRTMRFLFEFDPFYIKTNTLGHALTISSLGILALAGHGTQGILTLQSEFELENVLKQQSYFVY